MPVARTMFHIEEEKAKKAFLADFVQSVLMGTHQATIPLSKLRGLSGPLKRIHDFAALIVKEGDYFYKMHMNMCMGTEGVFVEALEQLGGRGRGKNENDLVTVSLNSRTIGGAHWVLTVPFLKAHAWDKNDEDGSYLNEGQLRKLWKTFAVPKYCESPRGRCKGLCCAMPGDTIYHTVYDIPMSYKYEPATQEELQERGYLQNGEGQLSAQARMAREDPSQLEEEESD